jgi:hypothetical protein
MISDKNPEEEKTVEEYTRRRVYVRLPNMQILSVNSGGILLVKK